MRKALRATDNNVRVSSRACPLLVPLIEEGLLDDDVTDRVIVRYLEPLLADGIDTLVLGCTHYPLLSAAIARALGREITLVDSARKLRDRSAGNVGSTIAALAGDRAW